jgi:hypothetical protein
LCSIEVPSVEASSDQSTRTHLRLPRQLPCKTSQPSTSTQKQVVTRALYVVIACSPMHDYPWKVYRTSKAAPANGQGNLRRVWCDPGRQGEQHTLLDMARSHCTPQIVSYCSIYTNPRTLFVLSNIPHIRTIALTLRLSA